METQHFPIIKNWNDIQSEIINKHIINFERKQQRFQNIDTKLYEDINVKMKSNAYKKLNDFAAINTIKYIFWEIRCGIFISIRNNNLEAFIPFANEKYINKWYKDLTFYGIDNEAILNPRDKTKAYIAHKKSILKYSRSMNFNSKYWWANHHFLNVEKHPDVWGQHSLQDYYDMLNTTLQMREVNDVMFIINKRDHPLLRKDMHNPYTFLFKDGKSPMIDAAHSFIPIVSPYSHPDYLDIVFPIAQDWILASKPDTYHYVTEDIPWENKMNIAFFRGSATGRVNNNQRIKLAGMKSNLLDVGITSWNLCDKIDSNGFVQYLIPKELESIGIRLKKKIPMEKQIHYKYLLNLYGHSAPNRTSWILQSGCLMLMVSSDFKDYTWLHSVLIPWEHYIPIQSDLSDLIEKIEWCIANDDKCREIVNNAKNLIAETCTIDSITSYMAYMMNKFSNNIK